MKKIFFFIGLIILGLILVDYSISKLLDYLYSKNYWGQSGGNLNYYLEYKKDTELLIIGDSRAHRHIIPDSFSCNTFSLCHHGMDLNFHLGILKILEQKNRLPKKIILHLEHSQFATIAGVEVSSRDISHLKYYYNQNIFIKKSIDDLSNTEKYFYFLESYRYNGKIGNLIKNYIHTILETPKHNGFEKIKAITADSIKVLYEVKKITKNMNNKSYFTSQKSIDILNEVIRLCNSHSIQLTCFISPYYFPKTHQNEFASQFLEKYFIENNVPFFDFQVNKDSTFNQLKFWKDATHLNFGGAQYFTQCFKKQFQSINCVN